MKIDTPPALEPVNAGGVCFYFGFVQRIFNVWFCQYFGAVEFDPHFLTPKP
jgi:hypothetical protein